LHIACSIVCFEILFFCVVSSNQIYFCSTGYVLKYYIACMWIIFDSFFWSFKFFYFSIFHLYFYSFLVDYFGFLLLRFYLVVVGFKLGVCRSYFNDVALQF
jgi:hypothetical protein